MDGRDILYPNADQSDSRPLSPSRRDVLAGGATAGAAATAGCIGGSDSPTSTQEPTVFVFNTGDGTVSLIDPERDELIRTQQIGVSSSFPSNQYIPRITDDPSDSLWINAGRGVRARSVESFTETASVDTESGGNWLEQTLDGTRVVVSAREPTHTQYLIDADPESSGFGSVLDEIDRTAEGGRGDRDGPGPCDVTIHPNGTQAYVPDIFGDTLTVLRLHPFEIETQIEVELVGDGPARPWMGTASPDGETLLVEHNEGETGTESIWDLSDPTTPEELVRLQRQDGLGRRPLTNEIGPDSETGYVFTPGSNDVTVVDLVDHEVSGRIDVGGPAFVGTWNPAATKLYVPVQTADEVVVIEHASQEIVDRIEIGPSPYGATAARVRPGSESQSRLLQAMVLVGHQETTYCIGNCACGHEL